MKFATVRQGDRLTGARVEGSRVVLVDAANAVDAYLRRESLREIGELDAATAHFARVSPTPAHILCVGLNYKSHIAELGLAIPEYPTFFAKFASTLTGPRDDIVLPSISSQIQGEVELAIVIGRTLRRGDIREAEQAIAGFCVANDLTLRDWQHRTTQALQGKVFDRSTPLGPFLVSPEEVDGGRDLTLTSTVDGILLQEGSTRDFVFSPAELVSYCSSFLTLVAGDVILTGTPARTSQANKTLVPATVLVSAIEGLGEAINPLRAE